MISEQFKVIDGIKIFHEDIEENHSDYNSQGLDDLYKEEEKHFWFIARKEYILKNFNKYVDANEKIIEIGAGTGNVSRYLNKNGYKDISVGEMHIKGLKYAKSYGIKNCYQFNLLNSPFEKEFDTVCMFDVLEHIEDDSLALQNVSKMLNFEGKIILTVSSHMWLWSREDKVGGHKIRYTKKELINRLEKSGFEILTARYFFMSITPLLYLRTLLNKDNGSKIENGEHNTDISMNPILSNILLSISRIENRINSYLPNLFGGSLFVMARKK